ncbi:MAG: protein translocase subunit SecD [Candidatus Hydrogenedentes bacterium]|nr:protein translocase subunit SecD [Candidatus Hydrogenedentota bacterium]
MRKNLYRTLIIYLVLLISIIYVYPTIGWATLSPEQREARLAQWDKEDASTEELGFFGETSRTVKRWIAFDREWVINLGLDLQGGVEMIVGIDYPNMDPASKQRYFDLGHNDESLLAELQQQVKQRIERRANEFGTKEPIIQTMGTRQIQIQLPGEKDVQRAKKLIISTAYLSFHIVAGEDDTIEVIRKIDAHFKNDFLPRLQRPAPGQGWLIEVPVEQFEQVNRMAKEAESVPGLILEDRMLAFSRKPRPKDRQVYTLYLLKKESVMTGDGLTTAVARPDSRSGGGQWEIAFGLDAESGRLFGERTEQNIDQAMAIVVDGVVEAAPNIQSRITTSGSITGRFDQDEARDLAIALNSGSLPVPVKEELTGYVGARLGEDSIRKGVFSCIIGIIIVFIGMTIYYHALGFIACTALLFNGLLILAAMAYMGATLTLPGIAGLILTLGMAVDANVLIYERMREELRLGKTLTAVIAGGYSHAFPAILDGHVTTLISGIVLLQYGSGPIQGFAVTLTIGIAASLFTSLTVTRAITEFLMAKKLLTKITMLHLIPSGTKIPFLAQRTWLTPLTVVLMLIGLVYFGYRGNDNFGVEFTTGTNVVLNVNSETEVGDGAVRSQIEGMGFEDPTVTAYEQTGDTSRNRFMVHVGDAEKESTTGTDEQQTEDISVRMQNALASLAGGDSSKVVIEKVDMVGPAVGEELKWDAALAVFWATIFIMAYLWFRFELKFSIGAIASMMHDVGITIGLLAISGREISLGVVAAVLTVIGYSLNDTIVVFDRLREDLKLTRGRGMSLLEIMDRAINATLSRTLLTSPLTLCVVLVLFLFGGAVINDFAFVLAVGIIVGTYSSIYVASPIVYWWQKYFARKPFTQDGGGGDSGSAAPRRYRRARSADSAGKDPESTERGVTA